MSSTVDKQAFSIGEFCAGGGGGAIGFGKYFQHRWLNDFDKTCCETLSINFPDSEIIHENINKLDFMEEKYQNLPFVFIGSPCQSFSYAGKQKGLDDEKGRVLIKFLEFLEIAKPITFLIENVKGLMTHNNGETLNSLIDDMKNLNYCIKYELLDASHYNVPQKRERMFLFGSLLDDEFDYPEPTDEPLILRGSLDNIEDNVINVSYPKKKIDLYKKIPAGGCWKNLPIKLQKEYLGESYKSGGGKTGILARLSWDKPSYTILTTPTQKQTERCHPDEIRPLTVKESARIQTFPDDYKFAGSHNQAYKQIGNAVPVKLAEAMAKQVYLYLSERKCIIDDPENTPLMIAIQKSKSAFDKLKKEYDKDIEISDENIDLFKKIFDITYLGITEEQWQLTEKARKQDKAVNNQIGYIHQTILGNAVNWINLDDAKNAKLKKKYAVDLCTQDFSIFVELKNKYNTMNSSSKLETIRKLKNIKKIHPDARLIIAAINSDRNNECDGIEYMNGYYIYKLVFGYPCFIEFFNWLNTKFTA
jgi:DNA (cytosine-5)-methyltransferase 1